MNLSPERQKWRRTPISALASEIRMDVVRENNIYPTCRLDKSSRALYEPEDVWAKRAALAKIDSRSSVSDKTKGFLKQRVLAMKTTGVTKENMEAVDRVKQTVAILMSNKERAADIGRIERRILQPQVARDMDRMGKEKRAEFGGRVQTAVERMVYAAKRRYVLRQEKLDKAGIFHSDANAQRVHTQFWASLQSKVDITKIENAVWAKMCAENKEGRPQETATMLGKVPVRLTAAVAHEAGDGNTKSGSRSSKSSTNRKVSSLIREQPEQQSRSECGGSDSETIQTVTEDPATSLQGSVSDVVDIPGYDEVGHVPTLEEFRRDWPRAKSRSNKAQQQHEATGGGGPFKGTKRGNGGQRQGPGRRQSASAGVVQDLSRKDEVFRHFKKFYKTSEDSEVTPSGGLGADGGVLGLSLSAAGSATGILQPDLSVVEIVVQHAVDTEEARQQMKVGEGVMSTPFAGGGRQNISRGGDSGKRIGWRSSGSRGSMGSRGQNAEDGDGGLTNVFQTTEEATDDSKRRAAQTVVRSLQRFADPVEESEPDTPGCGTGNDRRGDGRRGRRGLGSLRAKEGTDTRLSTKGSLEGSSTAAELKTTLEAAWRALQVPARLKLDFLQKYSTLERALDLPRTVHLLHIAAKAIPLKEKVTDLLHRIKTHSEPISSTSAFSTSEEDELYELDCWLDFVAVARDPGQENSDERGRSHVDDGEDEERRVEEGNANEVGACVESLGGRGDRSGGDGAECGGSRSDEEYVDCERKKGQQSNAAATVDVAAWLTMIEFKLSERCAEACDLAWYEVGETITYQGRSVSAGLPSTIMDAATLKRENRERNIARKGHA